MPARARHFAEACTPSLAVLAAMLIAPPAGWAAGRPGAERSKHRGADRFLAPTSPTEPTDPSAPGSGAPAPGPAGETQAEQQRTRRQPRGRCQLTAEAGSQRIAAGEAVTLTGRLECPQATSSSDRPVTAYQHEAGVGGANPVGEAVTQADGSFELTTSALESNSVLFVRAERARSPRIRVKVAPLLILQGSYPDGTQLVLGRHRGSTGAQNPGRVTFTGRVSPARAGATVVLLRQDRARDGQWRRIGLAAVADDGSYELAHTFRAAGDVTLRALVRMPRSVPGISEPLSYTIASRQNPRLTIASSANPLIEGQPLTITGTLAGGAGQPVKLLARTGQRPFAVVAEGRTDASGTYVFSGQLPLRSTAYEVEGAKTRSIVLLVGVKYALTQAPNPLEVTAGQPLTFSGTVAPAEAGHPVYLQRENGSGLGFRTVEEDVTRADGGYSITHLFPAAGAGRYRIRVPRDAGLEGTAGDPFTITATAAVGTASG